MPVNFINHKGKQILYADYRGLKKDEEHIKILELEVKYFKESKSKILLLADFRDSTVGKEFMNLAKKYGKEILNIKTEKSAILGITGLKKILLMAYNRFSNDSITPFDSEEKAKEFLVS